MNGTEPIAADATAASVNPESQLYLIDKSAWEQRPHGPEAAGRLDDLVGSDRAATCLPAALEVLYSARNRREFDDRREFMDELAWLPATTGVESTAVDIMAALARKGQHRIPVPDLVIAATALVHEAVVLHYDRDFERIAEVSDLQQEWIVPRGSGHGRRADSSG